MKNSAKRLLSLLMVLTMALSLLPGFVSAEDEILVAEDSAAFATDMDAFNGVSEFFTPESNGTVYVKILFCDPGYYVDVYEGVDWLNEYAGSEADTVSFAVRSGLDYEIILSSYNASGLGSPQAGSVSYQITFVSNGESGDVEEPEDPALIPGATPKNPLVITGSMFDYIGAGKTTYFLYDNTENMTANGVYSMMLHVSSSADYTVSYTGQEAPVDENGFVNYEMVDTNKQGLYRFSITNNSADQKFFSVEVKNKPVYVVGGELVMGRNNVTLDSTVPYTLYEFSPTKTGIYQIKAAQGRVGDWGTPYNPVDNTPNKTNTLIWTCTAVGQTLMVGFTGPKATTCTIIRTGDYIPPPELIWNIYENTYDFSYELAADAEIADIDLTDGNAHTAVVAEDGFYHYGSVDGPLMVADLNTVEINISDAYTNGGLRAWLLDEKGDTISKNDYNEALYAYYLAGPVPVTKELAMMLQELGQANGWWVSGGMVFTGEAPADLSQAWMQLCGYLVENEGVTLSGSITTGTAGSATLELWSGEAVVATVTGDGSYIFEGVAAGSYTLSVRKENHVQRTYTVTVEKDAVVLDVKLHLIGDIDGNGKINVGDVAKLNGHIKNTAPLTDAYQQLCANVNGGSLNMGDTASLYAHIKGTKTLY